MVTSVEYTLKDRHQVYNLLMRSHLTREQLRNVARQHNIKRGKDRCDTVANIAYNSDIPLKVTITI